MIIRKRKKPRISTENKKIALEWLTSKKTFAEIGRKYGKSRACVRQTINRYCKHFMLDHERLDRDGKMKPTKDLRRVWNRWALIR